MGDQGSEFYSNAFKDFLKINKTEMYSTYNEGKSVVADRFIRIFKNKIFKHMAAISKNNYFNVLDDIVNKYNNTVHKTIKMKPIDITHDYHTEYNGTTFNKDSIKLHSAELHSMELYSNKKILNLKLVTTLEFQNIKTFFAKGYTPNWSEEIFVVSKIKNTVPWTYVIND